MKLEGIHINNAVKSNGMIMVPEVDLIDYVGSYRSDLEAKLREEIKRELEEKATILSRKELAEFFGVSYDTPRNWRDKGHPKFKAVFINCPKGKVKMNLFEAEKLKNKILGL